MGKTIAFLMRLEAVRHLFSSAVENTHMPEVIKHQEQQLAKMLSNAENDAYANHQKLHDYLIARLDSSLPTVPNGQELLAQLTQWAKAVYPQERGVKGEIFLNADSYLEWAQTVANVAAQAPVIFAGLLDSFLPRESCLGNESSP